MPDWEGFDIKEFLDNDLRPSFVVDIIGNESEHAPQICYRNKYFTSDYSFDDNVALKRTEERAAFGNWALYPAANGLVSSFDYCGLTWVANTLRGRWRIIQASRSTPHRPQGSNATNPHNTLPSSAAVAQFERLKAFQLDHPNHDWTTPEPPPNSSQHVQLLQHWNWAETPLGPLHSWSPLLRLMANLIIADPSPAVMFWGPKMAGIYNEPYVKFLNDKHPKSLGEPYVDTWAELYADPATAKVLDEFWRKGIQEGKATVLDHQTFLLRNGTRLEERIFNLSLIPIMDNGTCVGFYEPLNEITVDHLNDRREKSLRKISQLTSGEEDPQRFFQSITQALSDNDKDFPFALLYSMGASIRDRSRTSSFAESLDLGTVKLESFLGVSQEGDGQPCVHDVLMNDEQFMRAVTAACTSAEVELFDLEGRPDIKAKIMEDPPTRGFGDEPHKAVVCPIVPTTHKGVVAILVLGVNPRRPYDADYTEFVQGLTRVISSSLASVLLVNEQKRLAGRAVEMEQRAIAMVDVSPVGNFLMDMDGSMIYVNEKWIEMTGYEHGHHFWPKSWLSVIREEYLDIMEEEWGKLSEERRQVSFELALKKNWESVDSSTGERISGPVYIIAAASVQIIGENQYITGALTDISHQKWVEGLQSQRRQEAVELKRQQENFMDMTSHEMRNPLSAIFQCADAIISTLTEFQRNTTPASKRTQSVGVVGTLPSVEDPVEYAIETAEIITLCAQHQKRIVDDVLILSKVDANLIEIHPINVQPLVLVKNAVKMFGAELHANDAHMTFEIEQSFHDLKIDWLKLDPGRLLQVLINLCTNAIKFTAESLTRNICITLGASTEKPAQSSNGVKFLHQPTDQIFVDPTSKSEWGDGQIIYLQFQVTDTGRGMSEEEMKRLFQRFSQTSPRTHTQYGGSGLGLFIARLLSRLQGGEIGVLSSTGHGSTFAFYISTRRTQMQHRNEVHTLIPEMNTQVESNPPDLSTSHRSPPLRQRECSDITILIVEDNLVNQRVLAKQLHKCGFLVQIANNGQEAVDFVQQSQFWRSNQNAGRPLSIILMDIEMPVMNGTEATKEIRLFQAEGSLNGHVPIVAITANARTEQIAVAKESGMDDVLSKPFRIPELISKIETFVGPLIKGTDKE